MTAYEIITRKRDGHHLTRREIHYFINKFLQGEIKDYQMSALLMAIYFRGLDEEETLNLTEAYLQSGEILDLSAIKGKKIDKHSTGGVGDKISIILAPLVASLGVIVPMMSGRGLGHTGGTLDKLESIPGFTVIGKMNGYVKQLDKIGLAMFGQTPAIVPADRKIYALRDVTATVDTIPLITASIMSKKIAEGIDGLVLDVKTGSGAFIPDQRKAAQLAYSLIKVGKAFNKTVVAYLTSMDQPLGYKIGNWLEIEECIDCLQGNGSQDVMEIVLQLAGEMLVMAEQAKGHNAAREMCQKAIREKKAYDKFIELVKFQEGNPDFIIHPEKYERARFIKIVEAGENGTILKFNTREIGITSVLLGAGRMRAEDTVDPQAGIILFKKLGDSIVTGEPLLEIRTNKQSVLKDAEKKIIKAIRIGEGKGNNPPLITDRLAS
jgi:pyrimidine-nucleoside phosphorylase